MGRLANFALGLAMFVPLGAAHAQERDFVLEDYFTGETRAEGSFRAINGLHRSFVVDLEGSWDGQTLTLIEDFVFDDGERDRKTWRFTRTGATTYVGTREDVIGETTVRITGAVARFSYDVYLDPENQANRVRFHDVMTLRGDGTVLNQALVTKFGFPVAWTSIEFTRPDGSAELEPQRQMVRSDRARVN